MLLQPLLLQRLNQRREKLVIMMINSDTITGPPDPKVNTAGTRPATAPKAPPAKEPDKPTEQHSEIHRAPKHEMRWLSANTSEFDSICDASRFKLVFQRNVRRTRICFLTTMIKHDWGLARIFHSLSMSFQSRLAPRGLRWHRWCYPQRHLANQLQVVGRGIGRCRLGRTMWP